MGSAFSTSEVARGERLDFWREMVSRHFVPLRIAPLGTGDFSGAAQLRSVGALEAVHVIADPLRAARTRAHVERSAGEEYFVALHLRGHALASQDGRRAALRPGDLALLDSARPYTIEFGGESLFEHLIVRIPRTQLDAHAAHLERVTSIALSASGEPGGLVSSALRRLAAMPDPSSFVEPVLELLARSLAHTAGALPRSVSRGERELRELKRYTLAHLGDAELSPAGVAAACFVSVRQLHRLFARDGTTFGAFLKDARLRRCRSDLADPELTPLTIAEIARRRGYRSAPVFTRSFTDRYGVGPRAFRRALQRPPAQHAPSGL